MTGLYYKYYYAGYGKHGVAPLLAIVLLLVLICIGAGWVVLVRAKRMVRHVAGGTQISPTT